MRLRDGCFESKYIHFWFGWHFELSYETCGYFDNRPRINIALIFFYLTIVFPFRNKWEDECDSPRWGVSYHDTKLWLYIGGEGNDGGGNKWITFAMPWEPTWYRTSALKKDNSWEVDMYNDRIPHPTIPGKTVRNNKEFYAEKWKDILFIGDYDYTYTLKSGEIQKRMATVRVEEMEWRMKWFMWLPLGNIRKYININFNEEVGEETGSWKGGCTGCSFTMQPGESPRRALKRMETERKF